MNATNSSIVPELVQNIEDSSKKFQIVPDSSRDLGNTKTKSCQSKVKVKQCSPAKKWCFTFNNYTEEDIVPIVPIFDQLCVFGIFGKEKGEQGTPHLQGYVEFEFKCRPKSLWSDKVHWEKAKGKRDVNVAYCSKEGNVVWSKGIEAPPTTIERSSFYPYQEELARILEVPCIWNDRTIYWRYGDVNIGKTQFAKWLCVHLGAYVISGSSKHMLAQAQNAKAPIYIVLLSYGDDKVSYRAIEKIKDGLFGSNFGVENNKMTISNAPHMLVIGNEPPDENDKNFHPTKYNVAEIKAME